MAAAAKRVPALCATWNFGALAVKAGASVLENSGTALDAVEKCVNTIELDTSAQYYVGYGGLPNAAGAMELDAAIMIGDRSQYGAVMAIQGVRTPISVARKVLELSPHNILVGDGAKVFALANGFSEMEVLTADSEKAYREWLQERGKEEAVQGGVHSSQISGTQFAPQTGGASWRSRGPGDHDTVGVIGLDEQGNIVAGVSTSGWAFCHPGRVGDSPLVGCGLYASNAHGAAVATGDGEDIMRSCLSFLVVQYMRAGSPVQKACEQAIAQMKETLAVDASKSVPVVGVLAMDPQGNVGASTTISTANIHAGTATFPFATWRPAEGVIVHEVSDASYA